MARSVSGRISAWAVLASVGMAGSLAVAGTSSAQFAQGDGTAQDANQRAGGSGVNPTRVDFSANQRFRNAIVTGNAPNGLSFRGDVGYTAEREFRGELGSDDLFTFRRDSLYSGLSGVGIRGTDALQYQFALTTGNRPPRSIAGSLAVSRDAFTADTPAIDMTREAIARDGSAVVNARPLTAADAEELAELSGAGMWRLRSSAGYAAERSLAESVVGTVTTPDGVTFGMTASPLGGVRQFDSTVSEEAARLRDTSGRIEGLSGAPATGGTAAPTTLASEGIGYEGYLRRLESAYQTAVGLGGEDAAEGGEGTPTVADRIREQNQLLSDFLTELRQSPPDLTPDATPDGEAPTAEDGDGGAVDATADDADLSLRERVRARLREMGIEDATLDALRDDSVTIDDLTERAAGSAQSYFRLHMLEGRRLMQEGSFFAAEARFSLALTLRELDPTAAIARVHAQLGAGLYLSAASNLRETLLANPLLIGARYAPDLIPSRERLVTTAERLTALSLEGGAEGRSAALLLAYVGHHLDDDAMTERGLDRIDLEGDDPLAQLMRVVWLEDGDVDDGGG